MGAPDALDRAGLMPQALASIGEVQCVAASGGPLRVSFTTRSATSAPKGWTRDGRVLSRKSPSTLSCMKRSCQRQTQVLEVPVPRMISCVP